LHLDAAHQDPPIDLLEEVLRNSGQATLFGESVVVLPEAFHIRNYYGACVVDDRVEKRLITLSGSLRLCFVVGLVRNDGPRYSETILIDGEARKVLSHKSSCDGSKRIREKRIDDDNAVKPAKQ
jgi:hypothetical protein